MAIDRNRIAQQAEKLVVQGKIEAAISQFEILVKDNPRDVNTINKIGDLYARLGQRRAAVQQYSKIGESYARDGFLLKAIAIYKKIIKLDPTHLDSQDRLASLYGQQGLVLEARSAYESVADQYLRAGEPKRAIQAYQSLVRIDPENIKARATLADLMARDGKPAEAAEEYLRIGAEMERTGRADEARSAYDRATRLQPNSPAISVRMAEARLEAADVEGAIKILMEALKSRGERVEILALLGEAQLKAGRAPDAVRSLQKAIENGPAPARLHLRLARARLAVEDRTGAISAVAPQIPLLVKEGQGTELAALAEELCGLESGRREGLELLVEVHSALKNEPAWMQASQRLMSHCEEAGLLPEAIHTAERMLARRPADTALRGRIDQLRRATAAPASAQADAPTPAVASDAEGAPPVSPSQATAGSAPLPAVSLELPPAPQLDPDDEDFIAEHMTEADVFIKYGLADRAAEQLATVIEKHPGYVPAHAKLKEIFLEEGNREGARRAMIELVKSHLAAGQPLEAQGALSELRRFDPEGQELATLEAAISGGPRPAGASPASLPSPAAPPRRQSQPDASVPVLEVEEPAPTAAELQSVDRLIAQGRRQQAVDALRRLADSYGSHPDILTRMRSVVSTPPPAPAPPPAREPAAESDEEFEIEMEVDEAVAAAPAPPPPAPGPASHRASAAGTSGSRSSGPSAAAQQVDLSADLMDLASEVDAALGGVSAADQELLAGVEAAPEGHSLDEIVQAFKKGVEQQVGAEDFDTHYNLGIAYKEMGLMDEAIGEFQFASKDPRLLVDCCSMLGICFREKGMASLAVKWYRRGLDMSSGDNEETMLGLRYDLAELLVEMGEPRQAMDLFTEVFGINSKYRDVSLRIKDLKRQIAG